MNQVGARACGKKWALRVCGRALFREIGLRWRAGEINYNKTPWRSGIRGAEMASHMESVEKLLQRRRAVERACLVQKVYEQPQFILGDALRMELLVYMCNLAESMGFIMALDAFERVWERALVGRSVMEVQRSFSAADFTLHVSTMQADFRKVRLHSVEAPHLFAGFRNWYAISVFVTRGISQEAVSLLCNESVGSFWLLSFLLVVSLYVHEGRAGASIPYRELLLDIIQGPQQF